MQCGRAEVSNKGKRRAVFLPDKLRKLLRAYLQKQKITAGAVFLSKNGRPLDRSNIWRDMKKLCESAGVEPSKVFPHNLRHLFARTFYALKKDLSRWRTFWVTAASTPHGFIQPRAAQFTPASWGGWGWWSHNFHSVVWTKKSCNRIFILLQLCFSL